jgi:hypothetical protein
MAIAIFFGGMFFGTVLGLALMALLAASSDRCQCEEVEIIGSGFACAYPPRTRVSPALENSPQAFGA